MSALPWGLFDTVDACWLGTNDENTGPRTFEDERVAMLARTVYATRLQYPHERIVLRRFMPEDAATVRYKDEVEPALSYAEAMVELGDPMESE